MTPDKKLFNPGLFVVKKGDKLPEAPMEHPIGKLNEVPLSFFVAHRNRNFIIRDVEFSLELKQIIAKCLSLNNLEVFYEKVKDLTGGFNTETLNAKLEELQQKYIGEEEAPFSMEDDDNLRSY